MVPSAGACTLKMLSDCCKFTASRSGHRGALPCPAAVSASRVPGHALSRNWGGCRQEACICPETYTLRKMQCRRAVAMDGPRTLAQHFSVTPDPRIDRAKRHPLREFSHEFCLGLSTYVLWRGPTLLPSMPRTPSVHGPPAWQKRRRSGMVPSAGACTLKVFFVAEFPAVFPKSGPGGRSKR